MLDTDSVINYLLPILKLEKTEENYLIGQQFNTYIQALATYNSFISNNELKMKTLNKKWRKLNYMGYRNDNNIGILLSDNKALEYLKNLCYNERVVMFNENHFSINHRLLIHLLLKDLYEHGFRYLAFECIWEKEYTLMKRGYTLVNTGFYSREPMMNNLIKEGLSLGFKVFGYDDYSNNRELNQSINIYNKSIKIDSLAKVIVFSA